MRNIKTKITNIETALKQKEDVKFKNEYVDVTIPMLLDSLDDMRIKVTELENIKETFDFIILKNKVDKILKEAKKQAESKFDLYLDDNLANNIANAKNLINEAYMLYIKNELRSQIELATINQQIKDASNELEELSEQLYKLKEKKIEYDSLRDELKELKNEAQLFSKNIEKNNDSIEDLMTKLSTYLADSEIKVDDIIDNKSMIQKYKNSFDELNGKIAPLYERAKFRDDELKKSLIEQMEIIEKNNKEHEEQIRNIDAIKITAGEVLEKANSALGPASRAGLSTAYKEKREQFGQVKFVYMSVLIVSLIAIVLVNLQTTFTFDKPEVLINKLLVTLPLTIIAFLSGQYAYRASRSEEEYGHKEALSLSYEGLKQAVVDSNNKNLSEKLLTQLVEAQGKNIAMSMDKVHLTPIDKMLQDLPKAMNKLGVSEVTITEIISLLIQQRDEKKDVKPKVQKASNDETMVGNKVEETSNL
ncbi:coiled-coil domain-containing protein [Photobacterium leiognathi]|uniref:coiled-coil domain-containing protein n=1 Tax=Photobacterium leiognathi TaxID=553611 RepID=UPI002981A60A|nr:hypothetical protein [Photobacterium leiognathi]